MPLYGNARLHAERAALPDVSGCFRTNDVRMCSQLFSVSMTRLKMMSGRRLAARLLAKDSPQEPSRVHALSVLPMLAPRWQLLSSIANVQTAFKAEDHLTALATLSDQDFVDFVTIHETVVGRQA
ncbi:hypothetical protein WJX79_002594 [Trebouxia sp. C0005]